jgi:hypothetical protein
MEPHFLALVLGLIALLFWVTLNWLVNKVLDKFERKHADHHRR